MSKKGYHEIFIHYSGHGTFVRDSISSDERDNKDEAVVPVDWQRGMLLDDEIHDKLAKVDQKCRLTMVFDCCHSGSIADLQYTTNSSGKTIKETTTRLRTNIVMYSGCMDTQKSFSIKNNRTGKWAGALTSSFTKWLTQYVDNKSNLGSLKLLSLLNKDMDKDGYPQDPQLASTSIPQKSDVLVGKEGMLVTPGKTAIRKKKKRVVKHRKKKTKRKSSTKKTSPRRKWRKRKPRRRTRRELEI